MTGYLEIKNYLGERYKEKLIKYMKNFTKKLDIISNDNASIEKYFQEMHIQYLKLTSTMHQCVILI